MRVIDRIAVDWSPYAVTFSHDGTRLAIGGGTWYGEGGITLYDLRTQQRAEFPTSAIDPALLAGARAADRALAARASRRSVSSLAFSSDDGYLLASMWSANISNGAAAIYECSELDLDMVGARVFRMPLTGAHPAGVVRGWGAHAEKTLASIAFGEHKLEPGRPELTNHRIAVLHGHAVTGNHETFTSPQTQLPPSLIVKPLGSDSAGIVGAGTRNITAIGKVANTLVTGNVNGELVEWSWQNARPLPARTIAELATTRDGTDGPLWAHYSTTSVIGICALGDGRGAAVTAAGTLAWWDAAGVHSVPLELAGTPRSIAASPDRSLLAVGIKCNHTDERSEVLLIEPSTDDVGPWRTPRTREVAIAAHQGRSRGGAFDPIALGVLADALEETGCDPRILHHLRTHDPRLRTCWVLEQLST